MNLTKDFHYTRTQIEKIRKLRTLIENDFQLQIGTEDVFLSKFLYFTEWQVEKAFNCIHKFYEFKKYQPDWLVQGPLSNLEDVFFYTHSKFILPKPDRDGRVIIVLKVVDAFGKYPKYLENVIQFDDLIFEAILLTPQAQKYGLTLIYDLTNVTKNIMRVFSPSSARMLNEKSKLVPWTSRRIHFIQKGIFMNTVSTIFRRCLNQRLREQIYNHDVKNLSHLSELIGFDSLPAIYGGPAENVLNINLLYDYLKQNEEYLFEVQKYHKIILKK